MKRFYRAVLIVALPVLFLAAPAAAQEQTPLPITQAIGSAGCDPGTVALTIDGDVNTGLNCWDAYWCWAEEANVVKFEVLVDWPRGFTLTPVVDGEMSYRSRTFNLPTNGRRWVTAVNIGRSNCVYFYGLNTGGGWGDPAVYEARAFSGDGTMDVYSGNMWMVQQKVGQVLGAPVVANTIYAIIALAVGTMTLAMVIRGLLPSMGAAGFGQGSGIGRSGSGLTYPQEREVGDVD